MRAAPHPAFAPAALLTAGAFVASMTLAPAAGGATDVRQGGDGLNHRVIVAAGGGGGQEGAGGSAYGVDGGNGAGGLTDSPIQVTVLCPALVRSAMSQVGDDPLDVADDALVAVAEGRFIATPPSWHAAVQQRGDRLADGLAPLLPQPSDS